jgi:hypothetical protein
MSVGGRLARRLLGKAEREGTLAVRGIRARDRERAATLDRVGCCFVAGYNIGLELEREAASFAALDRRLAATEPALQGFLVEGAAMGATVRDAVSARGGRLAALRRDQSGRFDYLIHVGAGWGLARIPAIRRSGALAALDPVVSSLAYDGWGFHTAFFDPRRAEAGRVARFDGDRARAFDAGLGRALWFVAGADAARALAVIQLYPVARRPDLAAGLGLAMAYAGPATAEDWARVRGGLPGALSFLAQGVAFAAEARRRAGPIPVQIEIAAQAVAGTEAVFLAELARSTRPEPGRGTYEGWRAAIRGGLAPSANAGVAA